MKISVVTVCFNSGETIADCAASVVSQQGVDIEYIVIDGGSRDDTIAKLDPYRGSIAHLVSERDNGIYDAMNKGLALATGDYVGFLNSDDYFTSTTSLATLVSALDLANSDAAIGDVQQINASGRVVRIFRGKQFRRENMRFGHMPPHPSFYARPKLLRELGGFESGYRIAGDFDLMVRYFNSPNACWTYVPGSVVTMRVGGASSQGMKSYLCISQEMISACHKHGLKPSYSGIYGRFLRKGREVVMGLRSRSDQT